MHLQDFNLKSFSVKAVVPLAIILITLFTYGDARHHQFLNFDDNEYVTENNHVQKGFTPDAIRWAFSFTAVSYWHPLTWISHILDCQLFGLAPGAHHMVNVSFHILNVLFIFLILYKITGARYKAALVALLFAVHPLNVESVAWVTERKTVLSMLFLMTALYAYVHYAEKKAIGMYSLVLFLFALGLMSKPSIITFPFLLLVLDYWPLGRFGRGGAYKFVDAVETSSSRRSLSGILAFLKSDAAFLFFEKVPFIILSLISTYLSMISMSNIVINHDRVPFDLRIYNLFVSILKYLGNMAWPIELSIFYPFPKAIPLWHFLLALSVVVLITVMTVVWRKSRPWLVTGWCWFLVALAPAGGLVQAGLWPEMANRFMYIPMIGLFLMLIWECDARIRGRYSIALKVILCCTTLVYFVSVTKFQNTYFSNSYALFTRAIAVTRDNFIAYNAIGYALLSLNRIDEAKTYIEKALAINPNYDEAYNNYGVCLTKKGDYANAGSNFSRAITINPKYTAAYVNLGLNQDRMGYPEEAIKLLRKALDIAPFDGTAHNNLGAILAGQGKTEEAIRHFQIAVEKKPNFVEARFNLSSAYEKAGLYDRAMAEYEALIKMKPADKGIIYYRMAGVFAQQNRFEECKRYLELSLQYKFNVSEHLKLDGRFKTFRESAIYTQFLENQEVKRH